MPIRRGDTVIFPHPPVLAAWAAVGGKKESEGPLAQGFDELVQDAGFDAEGCTGWEQAESMLQQRCARHCLRKAGIAKQQVELAFAGDLQAQCTASNYTMRQLGVPFAGLYGACSTMAEALCLAAFCAAAGYAHEILTMSSSHFCAAERHVRHPAGIWRQTHPDRPVDCYRCRGLPGAGSGPRACRYFQLPLAGV